MSDQSPFDMSSILGAIKKYLSEHEESFFKSQTERLAKENNKLRRTRRLGTTTGFMFNGDAYTLPEHNGSILYGLEIDLEPEMEGLLQERAQRENEIRSIAQMIFLICKNHAQTRQDLRDLLPEVLIPAIPELTSLDRTRQPAFAIQDDSKLLARWERLFPRIQYYTSTRLLYQ